MDNNNLTFTDKLRQRRESLFGAGDPLGIGQTPQGQVVRQAADIQAERLGKALEGGEQFQQFPQEIMGAEEMFLGRAQNYLQPLIQNALQELEAQEAAAQKAAQSMSVGGYVIDPVTGEITIDPEVEMSAQNILKGSMKLADVEMSKRPAVANRLSQLGFDPAGEVNNLLSNMETLFFGGQGKPSISIAGVTGIQQLKGLGLAAGKQLRTERGQRAQLYGDTREGFTSALRALASQSGQLNEREFQALQRLTPSEADTDEQARFKFGQLRQQIAQKYGSGTLKQQPMQVGSEGQTSGIFGINFPTAQAAGTTGQVVKDVYQTEVEGLKY